MAPHGVHDDPDADDPRVQHHQATDEEEQVPVPQQLKAGHRVKVVSDKPTGVARHTISLQGLQNCQTVETV